MRIFKEKIGLALIEWCLNSAFGIYKSKMIEYSQRRLRNRAESGNFDED